MNIKVEKLTLFLLLLLLLFAPLACSTRNFKANDPDPIKHVVLVWLKNSGNKAERQQIIDVSKSFQEIPAVISVSAGEVVPSSRSTVDDSFDVAILISFRSVSDMNNYITHAKHKEAVKNTLMPLVKKILVYDFKAE